MTSTTASVAAPASNGPGTRASKQLLHLVFGGELKSLDGAEFADISALDIVGIYPNYAEAYKAWKAVAQRTVDNAQTRYFIVHIHRLLDPEVTGPPPGLIPGPIPGS
jgi:hypothetical protein